MADAIPTTLNGYPVQTRKLEIGGRALRLLGPANFETLLDDPRVIRRFAQDEYMPYWADLWHAAAALAERIATAPAPAQCEPPPTMLELGCGLGLASLVALARGWRVIASDYDDDALAFVRASARASGLPAPQTRYVDWRERYSDLRPDWIVASEILYERRHLEPIATFLAAHLVPHGRATIVDGCRTVADGFEGIACRAGLCVEISSTTYAGPRPGQVLPARIFDLRLIDAI